MFKLFLNYMCGANSHVIRESLDPISAKKAPGARKIDFLIHGKSNMVPYPTDKRSVFPHPNVNWRSEPIGTSLKKRLSHENAVS